MLRGGLLALAVAGARSRGPGDFEDYGVTAVPRRHEQHPQRRPSPLLHTDTDLAAPYQSAVDPYVGGPETAINLAATASPRAPLRIPAGARPAAPLYDPMLVEMVQQANSNISLTGTPLGTTTAFPPSADLLLYYSFSEVNYLDGWARLTWLQYSCISATLWLNGEMVATMKNMRDYWYGSSLATTAQKFITGDDKKAGDAKPTAAALEASRLGGSLEARSHQPLEPVQTAMHAARGPTHAASRPEELATARPAAHAEGANKAAYAKQLSDAMIEVSSLDSGAASLLELSSLGGRRGAADLVEMERERADEGGGEAKAGGEGGGAKPGMPLMGKMSPEAKAKMQKAVEHSVEWLKLMASQQQLWGSSMLVGAVRCSQAAQMLEMQGTKWEAETPWRRYWLARRLQLEWLTNSAVEVWQAYAIPEAQLKLSQRLAKLNPKMEPWLQQITLADEPMRSASKKLLVRYSLRAEWYVWQCWKTQNVAEYMLALAFYQEASALKGDAATAASGFYLDKWANLKLWLPSLTGRMVSLGGSLAASKILLESPDDVVQALFMWSPKPSEGSPQSLERDSDSPLEQQQPLPGLERASETKPEGGAEGGGGGDDGPSRVKRFKAATHAALPYLAMQFSGALLYRNYFARLLLNAQLQSQVGVKLTAAKLQQLKRMAALRQDQQAKAAARGSQRSLNLYAQRNSTLTGADDAAPPVDAAEAPEEALPPAYAQPVQSGLVWARAQRQQQQQLQALLAQQAAQRHELAAQLHTPGVRVPDATLPARPMDPGASALGELAAAPAARPRTPYTAAELADTAVDAQPQPPSQFAPPLQSGEPSQPQRWAWTQPPPQQQPHQAPPHQQPHAGAHVQRLLQTAHNPATKPARAPDAASAAPQRIASEPAIAEDEITSAERRELTEALRGAAL